MGRDNIGNHPLLSLALSLMPLSLAIYGTVTGKAVFKRWTTDRSKQPFDYWLTLAFEYGLFVHGGAYVVFSGALNEGLEVAALEGTYASVIGGAPAAAVVFAGEVESRTRKDERLQALNQDHAPGGRHRKRPPACDLVAELPQWNELHDVVYSEKLGEMANEFDRVHSVYRALSVGALSHIIPPANLRSYLIDAVERGIRHEEHPVEKGTLEIVEAA